MIGYIMAGRNTAGSKRKTDREEKQKKKKHGARTVCEDAWVLRGRRDVVPDDVHSTVHDNRSGTELPCTVQSTSRGDAACRRGTRVHVSCVPGTVSPTTHGD